jgi:hypothetical protein
MSEENDVLGIAASLGLYWWLFKRKPAPAAPRQPTPAELGLKTKPLSIEARIRIAEKAREDYLRHRSWFQRWVNYLVVGLPRYP